MKTVLVIDDDASFRKQITQWLGGAGWCVLEAADGENGIHLAIELHPDAVICSLLMPGCNGFQICRSIRERAGVIEQPKIIVTTGSVYAADRRSAIEVGADECLIKPAAPFKELLQLGRLRVEHERGHARNPTARTVRFPRAR